MRALILAATILGILASANAAKAYDGYNPSQFISGGKVPQNPPVASSRDFGPYYGTGTGSSWVPSAAKVLST